MKTNLFTVLFLSFWLFGCNTEKPTPLQVVKDYYSAFDTSDFSSIATLVDDTLTIIDGPYSTTYTHASFHEQFRWDSIFQPTYEVLEIASVADQVIATVASSSLRYEFLKNNPLITVYKISFYHKKISKIEAVDYVDADWTTWQKEVDSLVQWISIHHPELDGFIHDLSMNGATNYLKAIELYKRSHQNL
ncbi:MAG: nuclear transport factor 2 family protein [Bacteroidota bacterium]